MSASAILFYILGSLVLTFAALTVFTPKIFRAAVFLLLSLIGIAGIYILMDMEFIAAIQIIIYVGGIVVLIIFSIFLTHQAGENLPRQLPKRIFRATLITLFGFIFSLWILISHIFTPAGIPATEDSVRIIGRQLLDYKNFGYAFPFELVSILLLAALIGSIVIAIKDKQKM